MTTAITVEGLVKDYGSLRALDGIDLAVERGEVFGFIGSNGAGKSTTIRVLLDLLRPTAGHVRVLDEDPAVAGSALRARVGYLPGELTLPGTATGRQLLTHLADVRGGRGRDRIAPLSERFLLDLDRPVRALSKGNKQKIGLVQAFMHRPDLALLDEPTSGLDPLLQQEFLALVREERDAGTTVFLSSHVLSEIEGVADRVAIIRDGRIVIVDDVAALRAAAGQRLEVTFSGDVPLKALEGVEELQVDGLHARGIWRGDTERLIATLHGLPIVRLELRDRDLEELVLDAYRTEDTA